MDVDLDRWCERHLGSTVDGTRLLSAHLSRVVAVRLTDGRRAVVKIRPAAPRLAACTAVQRALWRAGFPAPEPLAGPTVEHGLAVSAETFVPGGSITPGLAGSPAATIEHAARFAALLARLVALAPPPAAVGTLRPDPPWTDWRHTRPGVWPAADDRDDDLNAIAHPWLDETGARVRRRLSRFARAGARTVIGHGDWEARNLCWDGREPLVVHDWDSVLAAPEAVLAGLAASVWPCGIEDRAATVDESAAFLEGYQRAAGRVWSRDEVEASWAAGLWVYAFNAKKAALDQTTWLPVAEAERRLGLAGA